MENVKKKSLLAKSNNKDRKKAFTPLFECWTVTQLDVAISVHGQSKLNATISWSRRDVGTDTTPDKWQLSVKNLTWLQNDCWYHEWIYDIDASEYHQCILLRVLNLKSKKERVLKNALLKLSMQVESTHREHSALKLQPIYYFTLLHTYSCITIICDETYRPSIDGRRRRLSL